MCGQVVVFNGQMDNLDVQYQSSTKYRQQAYTSSFLEWYRVQKEKKTKPEPSLTVKQDLLP